MSKVITYGTFDLFHEGHRRLLERARALGDTLIVGITSDGYDVSRGKLNVHQNLMERVNSVRRSGLADELIIEEYDGQKIVDIQERGIDIFAIGSDWLGRFDYLADYCEVVYLERTSGISSTMLRAEERGIIKLGISGAGRIAKRFIPESKFVSGINVEGIYTPNGASANSFASEYELDFATRDYGELLDRVDAVYIASPHQFHFEQARRALEMRLHVLCEKPLVLKRDQAAELYALAKQQECVLIEGIKTAFAPGFTSMVAVARSGTIGAIRSVDATFTKLVEGHPRELQGHSSGGSTKELASYPLMAIAKLLGIKPTAVSFDIFYDEGRSVDLFSRISLRYQNAIATATVGLGVKSEGDLVVSGTKGYIYVPAPWWKTDYFEVRREDPRLTQRYSHRFDGDGLRYEIAEFASLIGSTKKSTYKLSTPESLFIAGIIEQAVSHASGQLREASSMQSELHSSLPVSTEARDVR